MGQHILTIDDFYSKAKQLREFFDVQFENPLEAHELRFVWDRWYVKDQYCLTRTPPYHYFPEDMYEAFHTHLVQWGRENLGCIDISPPWLSYYTDGDFQNWHGDIPHGPWAFVYSLTTDEALQLMSGGRTQILKPNILNFWDHFDGQGGMERQDICDYLDPKFNRLTLFDPRFPHRVETVHGPKDPRHGRLVLHGWFTEPRPFVKDFEDEEKLTKPLNAALEPLFEKLQQHHCGLGVCCYKIKLNKSGEVDDLTLTTNTVVQSEMDEDALLSLIEEKLGQMKLLPHSHEYQVTLPLIFE